MKFFLSVLTLLLSDTMMISLELIILFWSWSECISILSYRFWYTTDLNFLYFLELPVSKKTGFASFSLVFFVYVAAYIIGIVITAVTGYPIIIITPACMIIYGIFLRLHIVKRYNIATADPCVECLTHTFCCYCSTAQSEILLWLNSNIKAHPLLSSPLSGVVLLIACAHKSYVWQRSCLM